MVAILSSDTRCVRGVLVGFYPHEQGGLMSIEGGREEDEGDLNA